MADRTVTYTFRGNFGNLGAGLTAMGRSTADLGAKMTALDRNGAKLRAGLTTVGSTAGKVGLVAAAGFTIAVAAAAKFDQAMSNVSAATHATAGDMELLRQAALDAGQATQYSATEAAGAIEELAKAGVSTTDILEGGLAGALNLAAAGGLEVADAAGIASTAMTQFGLAGQDVEHVADLLAAGAGKAMGSVEDLGMALKQSGLVADQVGLSLEETTGGLAAFASAGLLGSDAGTSFKTMLSSLTPNSDKARDEMERLGISAYDAQGQFIGLTEFAGNLRTALAGMSDEQRQATLETIFGSDAVRAASVLYEQGATGIQGWIDKTDDAGYAAETAAIKTDNLAGDLERLKGSLETAFIGGGDGSQGVLRSLAQGADDVVNAFNGLPSSGKNAAAGLLAVTAVLGGGLWFTSKVVQGVSNTRQALDDLGFTANRTSGSLGRMARTAGGIAAVAGAVTVLGNALASATGAKLDSGDLQRDLESLAGGGASDVLKRITDDLDILGHVSNRTAEPIREVTTAFGLFGNTAMDNAGENIANVDAALAGMVESGNADQAAAAFAQIAAEITGLPVGTSFWVETFEGFESYATALDNAGRSAEVTGQANSDLADDTDAAAKAAYKAAEAQQRLSARMEQQRKAAREAGSSFIGLGKSLDDSKKSLGDWLRELEKQAQALRDFTQNARTAAKRGLDDGLIKSLNEAGPAGALRMKQLANATDAEIKRANKAWRQGQAAIREYVNMTVPPKKIRVDIAQGLGAIATFKARLDSLKSKTIAINVATNRAAGGPIVGPGTKTSDDVPVMASDGEFMMSAATVDHYGLDAMFALNARKLAAGGPVKGGSGGSSGYGVGTPAFEAMADAADAAAGSLFHLAGLGEKELRQRQRLAEKEQRLEEDRLDELRENLKAMRDAREQFAQAVSANFMSDIFGDIDLAEAARQGQAPAGLMEGVLAWARDQRAMADADPSDDIEFEMTGRLSDYVDEFLATLSAEQIAAYQNAARGDVLDADTAEAERFERLLARLTRRGLSGAAFQDLATSGNADAAQFYANMTPAQLRAFERQYERRNAAAQSAGRSAGDAEFSRAIRRQTREVVEQRAELQETNRTLKTIDRRLARLEKDGPERAGRAQGNAMNNAVGHGQRKGG